MGREAKHHKYAHSACEVHYLSKYVSLSGRNMSLSASGQLWQYYIKLAGICYACRYVLYIVGFLSKSITTLKKTSIIIQYEWSSEIPFNFSEFRLLSYQLSSYKELIIQVRFFFNNHISYGYMRHSSELHKFLFDYMYYMKLDVI